MNPKILIVFSAALSILIVATSVQAKEQRNMTTVRAHVTDPLKHAHAEAKITVQNSEAKPFDQAPGPALMEVHLNEIFAGDIDGQSTVHALEVRRNGNSTSLVSMQRFNGKWAGDKALSCCKVRKPLKTGRSRRDGSWFPDQGQANCQVCAARAALKASLEKDRMERWTIGSNEVFPLFYPAIDNRTLIHLRLRPRQITLTYW